jgi:hypothetical protein
LQAYRRLLKEGPDQRPLVRERLAHWQRDADLAGTRDPDALARLPEGERAAWRTLWADVDALARSAAYAK